MPGKKKGSKKKKKTGKKKRPNGMLEDPGDVVKRLHRVYLDACAKRKTTTCPGLRDTMKDCYENNRLIVKFILQPIPDFSDTDLSNVCIDPVVHAIRQERYRYIKELHVWDVPILHEQLATLALMVEKAVYPVTRIELIDCAVEAISAARLVQNSAVFCLTTLCLDYNEFGDEGCLGLCAGLRENTVLLSLSLCYCDLGVKSGKALGELISNTAIRDVYLNGNNLDAEGAIEIVKLAADQAEIESLQRAEGKQAEKEALDLMNAKEKSRVQTALSSEGIQQPKENPPSETNSKGQKKKKKGKGKKKEKEPPVPPPVGPWIHKLHLADNGIDSYGPGSSYGPVIAMRLFRQLIQHSSCLTELDLDDNLIGDLGGRDIMEGLKVRKDQGLPGVKVSVTHRMNGDTFGEIIKLGAGLQKKKKKGKGKKKKKK